MNVVRFIHVSQGTAFSLAFLTRTHSISMSICKYHFHKRNRIRFRYSMHRIERSFAHKHIHFGVYMLVNSWTLHTCRDYKFKHNAYLDSHLTNFFQLIQAATQAQKRRRRLFSLPWIWDSWLHPCICLMRATTYCF